MMKYLVVFSLLLLFSLTSADDVFENASAYIDEDGDVFYDAPEEVQKRMVSFSNIANQLQQQASKVTAGLKFSSCQQIGRPKTAPETGFRYVYENGSWKERRFYNVWYKCRDENQARQAAERKFGRNANGGKHQATPTLLRKPANKKMPPNYNVPKLGKPDNDRYGLHFNLPGHWLRKENQKYQNYHYIW